MGKKSGFKDFRLSMIRLLMGMICMIGTGLFPPTAVGQKKVFLEPAVRFAPKSYVCYKTQTPPEIEGKLNESAWKKASWTDPFLDIRGAGKTSPRFKTRVKMLWDEANFYIGAELEETDVWASLVERDSVIFEDNDFEVFIDPDGDTHNYYELEVNASNTVWDLLLLMPYRDNDKPAINAWDIRGLKTAVSVNGTINKPGDKDKGWTVEIAMPWDALKECAPNQVAPSAGDQWRINFSRVEHPVQAKAGKYIKRTDAKGQPFLEDNWVWSPQGLIDMHYPEQWGYVQFSGKTVGQGTESFLASREEKGEWGLRILYYCQKTYFLNNGSYSEDVVALECDALSVPGFKWPPEIKLLGDYWNARLESEDGKVKLYINQDGRIVK